MTAKRARKADGTFQADDPSTPDINEAFMQENTVAKEQAPEVKEAPKAAPVKEEKKAPGVYVAPGKSITSKKGTLGPGAKVEAKALDEKRIKDLIEKKVLVEVK